MVSAAEKESLSFFHRRAYDPPQRTETPRLRRFGEKDERYPSAATIKTFLANKSAAVPAALSLSKNYQTEEIIFLQCGGERGGSARLE